MHSYPHRGSEPSKNYISYSAPKVKCSNLLQYYEQVKELSWSQWRGSVAAWLLRLRVRIPPRGIDVCVECCVLSGRGLWVGLITSPDESYRLCKKSYTLFSNFHESPWNFIKYWLSATSPHCTRYSVLSIAVGCFLQTEMKKVGSIDRCRCA
jgi:hypothetical protein